MNKPDRQQAFQSLGSEVLDILVIGGGVVGAGVARDASMRGFKTGLVEQYDFAYGTSSRSSRLLHGGLRYLAQGRVGLVHEASVEKTILHRIAPHLAAPLAFVFPTYRNNRHWILWQLKIGVKIYDLLCQGRNLGASTWLSKQDVAQRIPSLSTASLKGAVRYYDGLTSDARLVIDTLRSARKHGALVTNYARATAFARKDGLWHIDVADQLGQSTTTVRAKVVVNACGPWAEGLGESAVRLRCTKGIHIVVESSRLSVPDAVVMTEEKRILFAIPWGDRTVLGTTDTDYTGRPEDVKVEKEDVRYVLEVTNSFFPKANLVEDDVVGSWAGLRPLVANSNGKPSDISRSHEIKSPSPGWIDVTGGKLTTYRIMAEQTVDFAIRKSRLTSAKPCRTAKEPLLDPAETERVSAVVPPEFSRELVEYYLANEWAETAEDIMVRRTGWDYFHRDSAEMAQKVNGWIDEIRSRSCNPVP